MRPDATRQWYVRVLDSTGNYDLDSLCLRRNVQDSTLASLEGKRDGRFLHGSTPRRPVLPSPASPRRSIVRHNDPKRPWRVRVLDSTRGRPPRTVDTCRIQNPDTPSGGIGRRAGGGGAAGGRAATAKLCVQHPLNYFVSGHDRQLSWKSLRGHKRIIFFVNRLEEHDERLTTR